MHKTLTQDEAYKIALDLSLLQYDSLALVFIELSKQLAIDSNADFERARPILAQLLSNSSKISFELSEELTKAWKICKPFM